MPPKLPEAVIDMMSQRAHRMHHYLWHGVRNGWLFFNIATQNQVKALGWEPPRPARRPGPEGRPETILDNASGEDFLYMHRQMIAAVNTKLAQVADPAYPRVEGWNPIPRPGDQDWPVPPNYSLGDPDTDAYIGECQSDAFFNGTMVPWETSYSDAGTLRRMPLGELGARIEFTIHNRMHMRWSAETPEVRPDSDPTAADAIDPKWDKATYNWLGDTYSSHVNPVFWKLHGWVDRRIDDWAAANGIQGSIQWQGTWVGPMPHDAPAGSVFTLMPAHHTMGGPHHTDHLANMVALAKILRGTGVACHFYDRVQVPPIP